MKNVIYVKLLEEGTTVFRPVPAVKVMGNVYRIESEDSYNPENETWEFLPGSLAKVTEVFFGGKPALLQLSFMPNP
ncbi:hypothetical protein BDE36_2612 [Arcticibacter tournemirensis]|uniref:Uncharacterized protein n=1 Tax=Arcticibacter tournemirensis TaxID=699437 RepID=A0A5M9GNA4_9SPHI|nr:hypothetical protein [Arcticibacter tournemirensis]KAA8476152.1 hypothetical protein F1649_20400 [Arcticibacter tournemirensis]TQM50848.1 hypothetical protein BDE36_2612 [Arcticibacter tournemirensis]